MQMKDGNKQKEALATKSCACCCEQTTRENEHNDCAGDKSSNKVRPGFKADPRGKIIY